MNFFYTYSNRIEPTRSNYAQGKREAALKVPNEYIDSRDEQLYLLESAKINQGLLNVDESKKVFETAISKFMESENRAEYTVSGLMEETGSLLLNNNVTAYEASEYEKIMAYACQSLNYLLLKDVEKAGVEIRRSLNEQKFFAQEKEEDIESVDLEKEAKKNVDTFRSNLMKELEEMDEAAALASNKYENPFTYFLAGIIEEIQGDHNSAVVSYKKGLKVMPDSALFTKSIVMVENMHFPNSRSFKSIDYPDTKHLDGGELIVVMDHDLIPLRKEVRIPFPTGNGISMIAFPLYKDKVKNVNTISIKVGNYDLRTQPICNVYGIASRHLKDQVLKLMAKAIVRVTGKVVLQSYLEDQWGGTGEVLSSIFNVATERADTRAWSLLAQDIQGLRQRLPVGEHVVRIDGHEEEKIEIKRNRKTLLYINWVNGRMTYKSVNL